MVSERLVLVVRPAKTSAISTGIRQFPASVSSSTLDRIQPVWSKNLIYGGM
jgi:hypothetical protein